MRKILVSMVLAVSIMLVGCSEITYHENGVPTYFLEPEGHVIAEVDILGDGLFGNFHYGYITNEDYQAYLDGTLTGVLVIKHPYDEGKSVSTSVNLIESIQVGVYEDYRGWD